MLTPNPKISVICLIVSVSLILSGCGSPKTAGKGESTLEQAIAHYIDGDYETAETLFTEVTQQQKSPEDLTTAYLYLGRIYMAWGEYERAVLTLVIDMTHGDESLLHMQEDFSVALRREDWEHHGVHIEVASLQTATDLRAMVVTSLSDPEKMVGGDSMAEGGAIVDVFLVAGEGDSETRFQLRPGGNIWGGNGDLSDGFSFPYWRLLTGITHNLEELPAEGLVHHVRQRIAFDWKKYDNGHGGPSMYFSHHRANTDEYSYGVEVQVQHAMDGQSAGENKQSKSLRREWNGKLW